MRVWSETETKIIVEIIKEIRCFYVENHLWPNWGIKITTYHSKISTTLSLDGPNTLQK